MLALPDPSQLLLCRGVTLMALPLLRHLFQHYSDNPKTGIWAGHRCSASHQCLGWPGRCRKLSIASSRGWVWGTGAPVPKGKFSVGWGAPWPCTGGVSKEMCLSCPFRIHNPQPEP